MGDVAIRVQGLSKQYHIGKQERYRAFRDVLTDGMTAPFRRAAALLRGNASAAANLNETIWALDDISFEVKKGDLVGIIGRNGAGKSTLLKVLSQITEPTLGRIDLYGRIGALLEVGTGFHSELTGRENIYLNGAILGMSRDEMRRKFDEIVAFAEVEKFIDTPIKHYSSGMALRLGFAVAAHMEPEILIVDEVLAVGDAAFQRKCLGKLGEVAGQGRTVLFVSHQMNQIRRLCEKCIWLDKGNIKDSGEAHTVVNAYEASAMQQVQSPEGNESKKAHFLAWKIDTADDANPHTISDFGPVTVRFTISVKEPIQRGHQGIVLFDQDARIVWSSAINDLSLNPGVHDLIYSFPYFPLRPGPYTWQTTIFELYPGGPMLDEWYALPTLNIETTPNSHPMESLQAVLNMPWDFACN